ncbi:hypothetical protein ACOL21_04025 [Aliarcobacter butzleri]|uniref:hypothetical protein n=1 Tax=Aliarcobacter butzleri TaxID=28197 RepID=UPI003AF6D0A4
MRTTSELISIVRAGGSLIIKGSSKTTSELISIVRSASESSQVIIKGVNNKTTSELISISRAAEGKKVIFDLTE